MEMHRFTHQMLLCTGMRQLSQELWICINLITERSKHHFPKFFVATDEESLELIRNEQIFIPVIQCFVSVHQTLAWI